MITRVSAANQSVTGSDNDWADSLAKLPRSPDITVSAGLGTGAMPRPPGLAARRAHVVGFEAEDASWSFSPSHAARLRSASQPSLVDQLVPLDDVPYVQPDHTVQGKQTYRQLTSAFIAPVIDAAAGSMCLASAALSAEPGAAKKSGIAGGALWAVASAAHQVAFPWSNTLVSAADIFGGAAGLFSLAETLDPKHGTIMGACSDASWLLNGAAIFYRGYYVTHENSGTRNLVMANGAANIAGAMLSAAATAVAATTMVNKDHVSRGLSLASSASWVMGAVVMEAAGVVSAISTRRQAVAQATLGSRLSSWDSKDSPDASV